MTLHVSSTYTHHQEVKIALHSLWYHHTFPTFMCRLSTSWNSPGLRWVPGIFPGGKGGRCVGLITFPPSCVDCQLPGTLQAWDEYQGYFPGGKGGRCIGLITFPPSCVDCQRPGTLQAWDEYQGYFPGVKGGRCIGQITFPPSCVDCQLPGTLQACLACTGLLHLYFKHFVNSLK